MPLTVTLPSIAGYIGVDPNGNPWRNPGTTLNSMTPGTARAIIARTVEVAQEHGLVGEFTLQCGGKVVKFPAKGVVEAADQAAIASGFGKLFTMVTHNDGTSQFVPFIGIITLSGQGRPPAVPKREIAVVSPVVCFFTDGKRVVNPQTDRAQMSAGTHAGFCKALYDDAVSRGWVMPGKAAEGPLRTGPLSTRQRPARRGR